MKNGKISGASAKDITGNEVLRLRVNGSSDSRFLYHLGFSLMYNREKQECGSMKLNDFFSGMPQELGSNSHWGTPKYATISGKSSLIRDCFGIQEKKSGCLNLRMNRYGPNTGCNGAAAIIIQVSNQYKVVFEESYDWK